MHTYIAINILNFRRLEDYRGRLTNGLWVGLWDQGSGPFMGFAEYYPLRQK